MPALPVRYRRQPRELETAGEIAVTGGAEPFAFSTFNHRKLSAFPLSGDKMAMSCEIFRGFGVLMVWGACIASAMPVVSPATPTTNRVSWGGRLVISANATSPVSALSYQWRFGSNDLVGATNSVLVLNSVQTNQTGVYQVNVTDDDGSVLGPLRTVLIGPTFTKVTTEPFSSGGAQSIAWGDANHDGWPDVFCCVRSSATATLYTNDTHGSFGRAAGNVGANIVNPVGSAWGDYDNKGALDLFIANNNGANDSLLHNNGDGAFTAISTGSIVSSAGNGNGCAWGDYDRDGFVDLYVANSDGNNFLFHNNGNGTFTRITTGTMVSGTGYSQGCAWIDYDGDGFPDLFVSRYQVVNLLFHNDRNGTFSKVTGSPVVGDIGAALGFCWGDSDNDGWPDLFVANGGANNFLYHNNGNGTFTKTNSPTAGDSSAFQTASWVDYDNDGWLDLFVTSVSTGTSCRIYHNNGDGTFTRAFAGPITSDTGRWFAAAWADINNDGFPDVLVSNISNPNVLHRNDGNDNHWLTVRCLGRISNRAAFGAKVRVRATVFSKTFWQYREITTSGNIGSQDQLNPMFGLGDATNVDTVRVEWPSGTVQEFRDVSANQIFEIKEPARLEAASRVGTNQISWMLRGGKNLTYSIEQSADLQTWTPWIVVTNLSGQMIFNDVISNDFRLYRAIEQ
jgi:hypothetical protein